MIAIIPAKGTSTGLPGKNLKDFVGRPLIAHTIETALECKHIDRVIVATEDHHIFKFVRDYFIFSEKEIITLKLPNNFGWVDNNIVDTYLYTIEYFEHVMNCKIDEFVGLLCTSPLKTSKDIDGAIELFRESKAKVVLGITESECPPNWLLGLGHANEIEPWDSDGTKVIKMNNRQKEDIAYVPNGSIFVMNTEALRTERTYYTDLTYGYVMPRERSIDIDTQLDFDIAEFLYKRNEP